MTSRVSGHGSLVRVRDGAAMALATASGSTDAIGYLALGHVFTSAMTGNLTLMGIAMAHRDGLRIGRVLVSLFCYMIGAALGARIARAPEPQDPVWPPTVTRALVLVGLICGGCLGALLVLHTPAFAPLVPLSGLAVALAAAGWQARVGRGAVKEREAHAFSAA
jgi:uncharacterized membrane protein YoaK (UPF0700 family)